MREAPDDGNILISDGGGSEIVASVDGGSVNAPPVALLTTDSVFNPPTPLPVTIGGVLLDNGKTVNAAGNTIVPSTVIGDNPVMIMSPEEWLYRFNDSGDGGNPNDSIVQDSSQTGASTSVATSTDASPPNLDCSDAWNVLYRSLHGVDSPCRQQQMISDLVHAGMSPTQAASNVDQIQQQNKSTSVFSDFFSAGSSGLKDVLIGAGVIFSVWLIYEYEMRKRK